MNSLFLESLIAISQHGSIAEAARIQGLTPTAISQRLKALETQLEIPLTTRAGKTVRLTEAALRILPHARKILKEQQELINALNQDRISGRIEFGAISTAMTGLLPTALKSLGTSANDLEIKLHPGTSAHLYKRLLADELDAVIVTKPPFHIPKDITVSEIRRENLCLIAAKGYLNTSTDQNSSTKDSLSTALHQQIKSCPFIRYDQKSWGGGCVSSYLRDHNLGVQEFCELDALEAIAVLVNSGLGLSLVPNWSPPWPEGLSLEKIDIPNPAYARQIVLLRKKETGKETALNFIWQYLLKSCP